MRDAAIIGAGLAGLAAAARLAQDGRDVAVFDKSRGTGGRLATRRGAAGAFDHGAPAAHGDAGFDTAMGAIGAERHGDGWRGRPGMSGLVKPLEQGVEILRGRRIVRVDRAGGWHLIDADGTRAGPFRHLLIAIPAPQAAALRPHRALDRIRMAPCWTLMAVRSGPAPAPAVPVAQVLAQGDRPGADPGALVAHADPGWSAAHLEEDAGTVADAMWRALAPGAAPATHAAAHRWRHARTVRALGRPFLDTGGGCLLGGDWALGPSAGDAWRSGRAMAAHVLGNADPVR